MSRRSWIGLALMAPFLAGVVVTVGAVIYWLGRDDLWRLAAWAGTVAIIVAFAIGAEMFMTGSRRAARKEGSR